MTVKRSLPPEVISYWPEVFYDIEVSVIPISYLDSVRVTFQDGVTWNIDCNTGYDLDDIESSLCNLCEFYHDSISNVDFRLDSYRVKQDISHKTSELFNV